MKDIIILGACGSIGTQTLDIIANYPSLFRVVGLSLGRDLKLGQKLIDQYKPEIICLRNIEHKKDIKFDGEIVIGDEGLISLAQYKTTNEVIFVNALVGSSGLRPTVEAIKSRKDIALANKETLVLAGDIINSLVKEYNVKLHPIDSEHSAIWQCLRGEDINDVKELIITASGGSFRDKTREELVNVTKENALKHPNWSMGSKITIDSATMMNKGFEIIEAHFLFNLPLEKIKPILHRQSIVHSLVRFNDTSIKANLGTPDMRIPILYALSYPKHYETPSLSDLILDGLTLTFEELSFDRYPMVKYAYSALEKKGFYLVALNAANEAAVKLFLEDKIKFLDIENIVYEYQQKEYNLEYNIDNIIKLDYEIQQEILRKYGEK